MKKSQVALSLALGMSLTGMAMPSLVLANPEPSGLFALNEVTSPVQLAAKEAKSKCGSGACGSKTEEKESTAKDKAQEHKCGSKDKDHKCGSQSSKDKDHKCGSDSKDAGHKCGSSSSKK